MSEIADFDSSLLINEENLYCRAQPKDLWGDQSIVIGENNNDEGYAMVLSVEEAVSLITMLQKSVMFLRSQKYT